MLSDGLLSELSQLLLKYGATLEDILSIVYPEGALDPETKIYEDYFSLLEEKKENLEKYPEGFIYKIRYNKDLSGKTIKQGRASHTTRTANKAEAVKEGFQYRIEAIKRYELNKEDDGKPKNGNDFYKMLNEYYAEGSEYLKDDFASNKQEIPYKTRRRAGDFIRKDFIPYLQENKIKDISEITPPIYNGFKTYLLEKRKLIPKTINNYLSWVLRIFENQLRNRKLTELPYTKGTAILRIPAQESKNGAELLPVDKLKGIFHTPIIFDPIKLIKRMNFKDDIPEEIRKKISEDNLEEGIEDDFEFHITKEEQKTIFTVYTLPLTIGILALNTGMRNSEIARLKKEDFIPVTEKQTCLVRIWNNKTAHHSKTKEDKYRKIPLHPFTRLAVKMYKRQKEALYGPVGVDDYLFGEKIETKDGIVDGYLYNRHFDKVVLLILKLIKHKENINELFDSVEDLLKLGDYNALKEELKEEQSVGTGITFYSFRKTFRTMLGLNNDLAEYYMGHKLGSEAKIAYIQVNKMDDKLFVDEYAEPVISMLNKYVFYTEEDLKIREEELEIQWKNQIDFIHNRIVSGIPINVAYNESKEDFLIKKYIKSQSESADKSDEDYSID
jgi:integrase